MIIQRCQISISAETHEITALIEVDTEKARFKGRLFYCGEAIVTAEGHQMLSDRAEYLTSTQ